MRPTQLIARSYNNLDMSYLDSGSQSRMNRLGEGKSSTYTDDKDDGENEGQGGESKTNRGGNVPIRYRS